MRIRKYTSIRQIRTIESSTNGGDGSLVCRLKSARAERPSAMLGGIPGALGGYLRKQAWFTDDMRAPMDAFFMDASELAGQSMACRMWLDRADRLKKPSFLWIHEKVNLTAFDELSSRFSRIFISGGVCACLAASAKRRRTTAVLC